MCSVRSMLWTLSTSCSRCVFYRSSVVDSHQLHSQAACSVRSLSSELPSLGRDRVVIAHAGGVFVKFLCYASAVVNAIFLCAGLASTCTCSALCRFNVIGANYLVRVVLRPPVRGSTNGSPFDAYQARCSYILPSSPFVERYSRPHWPTKSRAPTPPNLPFVLAPAIATQSLADFTP